MAKKQMTSDEFKSSLRAGLRFPWAKPRRLWNILWVLFIIFGWFALIGYGKKIVRELVKGNNKHLPEFGKFWHNFKEGVITFVFMIPTFLALMLIGLVPFIGSLLVILIEIFMLPWLVMNFFMKETFDALWDIKNAFNLVFDNAKEYLFAYLKTLVYVLLYGLLSLLLVGIPCYAFGSFYFLAQFYKDHNK